MSDTKRLFIVALGLCAAFWLITSGDTEGEDSARIAAEEQALIEWNGNETLTPAQKAYRMNAIIRNLLEVDK